MSQQHVLVVEDEERILTLISKYLDLEGYQYTCMSTGAGVVERVRALNPDLCILDLMLPHVSGLEICQQLREFSDIPIVMLTARVDEVDRLLGFKHGADDYVCKPFSPKELMARVAALLKRAAPKNTVSNQLAFKSLTLDIDKFTVYIKQYPIKLTGNEFNILRTLMEYPEKVFSRKELLLAVKQHELDIYERTIDSHIKNLRKKLSEAPEAQNYIESVYGIGYSLKAH